MIDGDAVTDPTADLGRVRRQQRFLAALMEALGTERNPFVLLGTLRAVAGTVTVDDTMTVRDVAALGLALRGARPLTATVPTARSITSTGQDVLVLTPESATVLADFRG